MKKILLLISFLFLASCVNDIPTTQFQEWGDYSFRLESRPPQVQLGMNEFLLIVNFKKKHRAYDLIINFRIGPTGKWNQAIQDGHTGVYRKALKVRSVETDVLYVYVKQSKKYMMTEEPIGEQVFEFPLNYSIVSSTSKSGE